MQTTTITYIFIAFLLSLGAAWFLYYFKNNSKTTIDHLLFGLRTLSVFLLLLLIINPTIVRENTVNLKPKLSVLVDNSLSVKYFNQDKKVKDFVEALRYNSSLQDKFELQFYQFGADLQLLDSLTFKDTQTNIYKALKGVEQLNKDVVSPFLLISDGNQTTGNSYEYFSGGNKQVFPVMIGDTIVQGDLRISQLNVNKYSYLNNKFPIEATVLYEGNEPITTQFTITHLQNVVFRKQLSFSKNDNVQIINTTITSDKEGVQYYTASVAPLKDEKNSENNSKTFSVEVLNEQTKILLLTSVLHPDLGGLKKAIETNKQRSVSIKNINETDYQLKDYQLIIVYQPNENFNSVFKELQDDKLHYFVVTGTHTNWNFLNEVQQNYYKNSINQSEDYEAVFNNGFLTFNQKDIGFASLPPLNDQFGAVSFNTSYDALLYQQINGFPTETPMLAVFENDTQKSGVLLGEGIWKWRAAIYNSTGSFQDFDMFLSNMIQFVASTKKRERLAIQYENTYPANTPITIAALYVDKNYEFDSRASLSLQLINTDTNIKQNIPFSPLNNSFEAILTDLPAGDYTFTVEVDNQTIKKSGAFKVTKFQIEEQFTRANVKGFLNLATQTNGKAYYGSEIQLAINDLLTDDRYVIKQQTIKKNEELIGWKLLLILIVIFLSTEWFIRKYYGKI